MEVKSQLNVKKASPYAHALSHYKELCDKHLPFIDVLSYQKTTSEPLYTI